MLRSSKGKLLFKSEALLEEFIWLHLQPLLNLEPVKRQYFINKQNRSDILGVNSEGRLAILELKKGEGKASIDQLLRYQDFFRKESHQDPNFERVDFSKKFLLIAIASHFNSSTIDYAQKMIPDCLLLTHEVKQYDNGEYFLVLKKLDNRILSKIPIEIIEDSLFESLPSFIQGYLLDKPEIRERVLKITQKILSYNSEIKIEEKVNYIGRTNKKILFTKFNSKQKILTNKTCAGFNYFPEENMGAGKLQLYVCLPTVEFKPRQAKWIKGVDEIDIQTEDFVHVTQLLDFNTILHLECGFQLKYPFQITGINEIFDNFQDYYINYRKYMKSRQKLRPVDASDFTSVDSIIQMALEDWSVR